MAHEAQQQHDESGATEQPNTGGMARGIVRGASGGVISLVQGTEQVLTEVVRSTGRLASTTAEEVLDFAGTVVGGVTDTVGAVFQGRRMPTRRERHRQDENVGEHTGTV